MTNLPFFDKGESTVEAGYENVVEVLPYRGDKSLPVAEEFIRVFYQAGLVTSFEIWHVEKTTRIVMVSNEPGEEVMKKVEAFYTNARTKMIREKIPPTKGVTPYIGVLETAHPFYPVRIPDLDPLNNVLSVMTTLPIAMMQVVFTPLGEKMHAEILNHAKYLMKSKVVGWLDPKIVPPSQEEKDLANLLLKRAKEPLFHVAIRFLVVSNNPVKALTSLVSTFNVFINPHTGQGFTLTIPENQDELMEDLLFRRIKIRKGVLRKKIATVLSSSELSRIAHIPGEEVKASTINWTTAPKSKMSATGVWE